MKIIGSRDEVWNGVAKKTSGGLLKKDLKKNKRGRIVSKKMSNRAKKEKRLEKAGYKTKKGKFTLFKAKKIGGMNSNNNETNGNNNETNNARGLAAKMLKKEENEYKLGVEAPKLLQNVADAKKTNEALISNALSEFLTNENLKSLSQTSKKIKENLSNEQKRRQKLKNKISKNNRNIGRGGELIDEYLYEYNSLSNVNKKRKEYRYKELIGRAIEKETEEKGEDVVDNLMKKYFVRSIELNNYPIFKILLDLTFDPNAIYDGLFILNIAIMEGRHKMIEELINRGANINNVDPLNGNTALIHAVLEKDLKTVNLLLDKGADITLYNNTKNEDTALSIAAYYGYEKIVERLINHYDKIINNLSREQNRIKNLKNKTNKNNKNLKNIKEEKDFIKMIKKKDISLSLYNAIENNEKYMVTYLINNHINKKLINNDFILNEKGTTFLISAIINNNKDIVKLLLKKGANPNQKNENGNTPLIEAIKSTRITVNESNIQEQINQLENNQHEMDQELLFFQNQINTIVMGSDEEREIEAQIDEITLRYSDIDNEIRNLQSRLGNNSNNELRPPNLEIVKLLLEYGADINGKDINNSTALMWASYYGYLDIVQLLLKKGANQNIINIYGMTAISYKNNKNIKYLMNSYKKKLNKFNKNLTKVLNKYGNRDKALMKAVKNGNKRDIEILLAAGVDQDVKNTLLFQTIISNPTNFDIAEILLAAGADINVETKNGTLLYFFAELDPNPFVVSWLLEHKADPNIRIGRSSNTALMIAAQFGHTDIVNLLLDAGAEKNLKNIRGETALMIAKKKGHTEIIKLLESNNSKGGSKKRRKRKTTKRKTTKKKTTKRKTTKRKSKK